MSAKIIVRFVLVLATAASAVAMGAITPPALPQVAQAALPLLVDVSLESQPFQYNNRWWQLTVTNNLHHGHSSVDLSDVKVKISTQDLTGGAVRESASEGIFDESNGIWTIPRLKAGDSAVAVFNVGNMIMNIPHRIEPSEGITLFQLRAELMEDSFPESTGVQFNNAVEEWYISEEGAPLSWTSGDAGIEVSVDNPLPLPGEQITFNLRSINSLVNSPSIALSLQRHEQHDVQIKITLSRGLQFASMEQEGITFDGNTATWDVGIVGEDRRMFPTRDVPVILTASPSLTELPLEQRCLTAELLRASPAFELDQQKRENDVATVCLGEFPPVLIDDGEIILWWLHDCVEVDTYPCGEDDELKLFAQADPSKISIPGVSDVAYLDPESVIVQVPDMPSLWRDTSQYSITASGQVSWSTGRATYQKSPGVLVGHSFEDLKTTAWSRIRPQTVTARGWGGGEHCRGMSEFVMTGFSPVDLNT